MMMGDEECGKKLRYPKVFSHSSVEIDRREMRENF
jgi:hypothetical protein